MKKSRLVTIGSSALITVLINTVAVFAVQGNSTVNSYFSSTLWIQQFGSLEQDAGFGTAVDSSGVYITGGTYGTLPGQISLGNGDAFVRKYDHEGKELWTQQFGTTEGDNAWDITVDSSGVYVAGRTDGALPGQASLGGIDAFVYKYNHQGNELWIRQFGTPQDDLAFTVIADSSGVYVAGTTYGALPGQTFVGGASNAFVRKYDHQGNELWTRQFGANSQPILYNSINAIAVNPSGVYVAGETGGALPGQTFLGGINDAFVRKYDHQGNELWTRQLGTSEQDFGLGITVDSRGVYVAGETGGALPGQTLGGFIDAFVRKYDHQGNELWTRQFGTSELDRANNITVDSSGIYVAGETGGALPGQTLSGIIDAFVRKYDHQGNELWTRQLGTSTKDEGWDIIVDPNGVYVAGLTHGALPGQASLGKTDAFAIKLADE